jgi:hypothetical protein
MGGRAMSETMKPGTQIVKVWKKKPEDKSVDAVGVFFIKTLESKEILLTLIVTYCIGCHKFSNFYYNADQEDRLIDKAIETGRISLRDAQKLGKKIKEEKERAGF